jgi:Carboxypeptidase regulatory-like domain
VRKWIGIAAVYLIFSAVAFGAGSVTLEGKVTDTSGKPLQHATVLVYHAGVKTGYSVFCPSCYADCGKRALTDSTGTYIFKNLAPDLWFELAVVRDGYVPTFIERVDPSGGSAPVAVLRVRSGLDPLKMARGRVIDPNGNPMSDVLVQTKGVLTPQGAMIGQIGGLEPLAVTNDNGEFETAYVEPASKMLFFVEARTMAPQFVVLPTGTERHTVRLTEGAVIRGRLVENGKGVGNAEVGLIPKDQGGWGPDFKMSGSPFEEMKIGTQEDGSFAITNVPSAVEWYVYGKMASLVGRGATEPVICSVAKEKQQVDLGNIEVKPGRRLRGRVVLGDDSTIPSGMRITIESKRLWDFQTTTLGPDGRFEFADLFPGEYTITPAVRGYSAPDGTRSIPVSVDRDVDNWSVVLARQANGQAPR